MAHWQLLSDANLGDEKLRHRIAALEPFVRSLSRIDDDGQKLRYHLNREEEPSLATYSLANLEVIRDSLGKLSDEISGLRYRTVDYIHECRTHACTNRLSRRDLMWIAQTMPPLSQWREHVFDEKKQAVKDRLGLSNTQFSEALTCKSDYRDQTWKLNHETRPGPD